MNNLVKEIKYLWTLSLRTESFSLKFRKISFINFRAAWKILITCDVSDHVTSKQSNKPHGCSDITTDTYIRKIDVF